MNTTPTQPADRGLTRLLPRPLLALLRHPRIEPRIAAVLRSTAVRQSPTFALRELAGRPTRHVYTLRESGMRVLIEHGGADAHALDQAFYQHAHEPPAAVVALLRDLDRPLHALDLGANVGMWGLWLHGRFAVERILALEPDPANVRRHRRQIELNHLERSWEVLEAAAVTADGPVFFTVGKATNGRVADVAQDGVESVPGRDTFALLDGLDLLKIDIEGGEWTILADPRAGDLQVPVVMLEYHAHNAPSSDPQAEARRALERAGYATETGVETDRGFGVVWGWKHACASAST
jgi:FkbM family methyltransferase